VLFVYWADASGYQALILKEPHEVIAIVLMGAATVLFLIRTVYCRTQIDLILFVMSVNFLCREIHFKGTDNAVVIVAGLVFIWGMFNRKQIWDSIKDARLFQICLVGAAFTYLLSILIARRVFSLAHFPILPNELKLHIALEEILENIAHLCLFISGTVAFRSIPKRVALFGRADESVLHQPSAARRTEPNKGA
jgi:hypothetical protein